MRIALVILFLISAVTSFSQRYNIEIIGIKNGLLHSLVTGIDQDEQGRIWLSTGGGLCCYNGFEFKYLTTRDGLNYTRLTDVVVDGIGNIWTGSLFGLNMVRGNKVLSIPKDSIGEVVSLDKSSNGVWGLSNYGIFNVIYINGQLKIKRYQLPVPVNIAIGPIFQDRQLTDFVFHSDSGDVLVGYKGNLYVLNDSIFTLVDIDPAVYVNSCSDYSNGEIFVGTSKGLYKLQGKRLVKVKHSIAGKIDIFRFVTIGSQVWCIGKAEGSDQVALHSFNLEIDSIYKSIGIANGLPDIPTKLYVDHEKNLWILTNNGIAIQKGEIFTSLTTSEGLTGNKVWGIGYTTNKYLWVGTIGEGLTVIAPGKVYRYSIKKGLPDNYIGKIFESSDGRIYVGTSNAGLNLATYAGLDKGYNFSRLPLLPHERVRIDDILEDRQKRIWVATSKGLFLSANGIIFNRFPLFKGDTGGIFVQKIHYDSLRNRMWIGNRFNGIFYIENGIPFRFNDIESNSEISTLTQDLKGNIWFGTRNNGVYFYDGLHVKQLKESDGISSNLIYVLYADEKYLWIGTNLGLDRIDLAEYDKGKVELKHYGSNEGLPDLEINLNGILGDGEGGFWIATNGGLAHYQKNYDIINNVPPKVTITNLLLRSQPTNWAEYTDSVDELTGLPIDLKLSYWQNHITFEFAGISFKNPQGVRYAWFLEGLDKSWIESKSQQAVYSNLKPGNTYRFHLKAANSDGVWSNEVVSMPIFIAPPFWGTWWFRFLVIILLGLLIYWYVSRRIELLKERQEELEAMVEKRTAELREQLEIVDDKNRQIMASIMYAKFLQSSMFPAIHELKSYFSDAFVFYRPKDFVSGDFYWYYHKANLSVFAVADCTGHGVPGAIVSVICENALRNAVKECNFHNPALILSNTNECVVEFFSQSQKSIHDGMEIALAIFDHQTMELEFCGANLPLYYTRNGRVVKFKPDIYRIGWDAKQLIFSNQRVKLAKNDMIFAFTDGFPDQFGAEKAGQKFSSARLKNLLSENQHQPYTYIEQVLAYTFDQWQGANEQTDDVLVMGIKV